MFRYWGILHRPTRRTLHAPCDEIPADRVRTRQMFVCILRTDHKHYGPVLGIALII
jgi:hypothetical protein